MLDGLKSMVEIRLISRENIRDFCLVFFMISLLYGFTKLSLARETGPTNAKVIQEEADRLYTVLNAHDLSKTIIGSGFKDYSDASKTEILRRLVARYEPSPSGELLARLLFIRTTENEAAMRSVFIANLRASDHNARKFSLYGLKELGHEALVDLALLSMRDSADTVVAAAILILLPKAKEDVSLMAYLQDFFAAKKDDKAFYMSMSLLMANGIVPAHND